MKKISSVLIPMLVLATLLISACTGAATPASSAGGGKVEAAPVDFTGVIESMNGNQWVVGGQTITVDPSVIGDGPFVVGDTVKVEAEVQADGSIVVTRVEAPGAADNSNTDNGNDANSNDDNGNDANSNDSNSNDDNGNASNSNDDNSNDGLVFDNSGTEAFGTVDSITTDTVVIAGQTFTIANGAEFKSQILAGDFVKVHFTLNADGTLSITEIETWDPALVNDGNSNDDNGNDSNSNDDNGNDDNSNDDNGNDDSSDDDNGNDDQDDDDGGNSNDD